MSKPGITLQLEQRVRVDFEMETGNVAETITVTSAAQQITEAYTSERGQVIENKQIVELPLNGREYTHLLRLTPGAIDYRTNNNSTTPDSSRPRITFGNISSVYNRYLLDGASNTDIHDSQAAISPSIEAIQEFNVKGNHYNAEYGGGGGIVNVTIKSGGNDFHGALFEFLRNDKLDARPFFSPTRSPFRFNQFGGVVSGPVHLPRFGEGGPAFISGRDRTFFLFNYEGLRARNPSDRRLRVPTLAERNGNFSALTYQLYDPFNTNTAGARLPFAGNIIPRARWNQFAAPILDFYPLPNQELNARNENYFAAARNQTDADQITLRIDHRFSDRLTLFGRYSKTRRDETTGESFLGAGGNLATTDGTQGVFGLTGVITPNVVSETRFGVTNFTYTPEQNTRLDTNFDQELGFPFAAQINPVEFGFPSINATGFTGLGTPRFRAFGPNLGFNINQSITYTRGNHTFKFGGNHERNRAETRFFVARTWSFNGSFTSLVSGGRFTTPGSSFADFLLGTPQQIIYGPALPGVGRTENTLKTSDYAFYVQDDWRVNRRLTINYGLRYDLNLPPIEENDRTIIGGITPDGRVNYPAGLQIDDTLLPTQFPTQLTIEGRVVPAGRYFNRVDRRRIWDLDANNFQPRLGAAILPFGNERTVIRLSGGLFNARNSGKLGFTAGLGAPFFIQQIDQQDQTGRPGNLRLGELPAAQFSPSGIFQYNVIPLDNPDPFIQSWTGSIQRELPGQLLLELSYLGNRAYHVSSTLQLNVRKVPGAENGTGCPAPAPSRARSRAPTRTSPRIARAGLSVTQTTTAAASSWNAASQTASRSSPASRIARESIMESSSLAMTSTARKVRAWAPTTCSICALSEGVQLTTPNGASPPIISTTCRSAPVSGSSVRAIASLGVWSPAGSSRDSSPSRAASTSP